ncbi:MAG: hypothetical protein ABI780_01720 [Ardenticatenales bacterium]
MAYITIAELKAWALDNVAHATDAQGNSLDALFTDLVEAAARQIDQDTGRRFAALTAETRLIQVQVDGFARFRDLTSVTSVTIDHDGDETPETVLAATDYVIGPKTDEFGAVAARYQWMRASRNSTARFSCGTWLSILGNWGYTVSGVAPYDIKQANKIRAAWLWARRDAKLGTVAIPGMGVAASMQRWDTDYQQLIAGYIHPWNSMPGGG